MSQTGVLVKIFLVVMLWSWWVKCTSFIIFYFPSSQLGLHTLNGHFILEFCFLARTSTYFLLIVDSTAFVCTYNVPGRTDYIFIWRLKCK